MNYYFIGIKGTGMAALACMLYDLGNEVSGSDLEKHFFTEDALRDRNIPIFPFNPENIKDNMNVIIGNAFLEDFPEVIAARKNQSCICKRYHEFLGSFLMPYNTIAVAGSHGKTTSTSMLSNVLRERGSAGWLIGDGNGHILPDTRDFALEACEYRRHFLAYHPDYAIITNVDIDHVDYFKDEADYRSAYEQFSYNVKKGLIIYGEDLEARKMKLNPEIDVYWYGLEENDDSRAINVEEKSDGMSFDLLLRGDNVGHVDLPFVGHHLLLNSIAVITAALLNGMELSDILEGLRKFKGAKRRFVVEEHKDNIYIDDYAHHPTEVSVTIDTAKKRFPGRKLVAVFKPHRASRVLYFADDFAKALSKADKVYLLEFSSIDDKQDGTDININYLQERIKGSVVLPENNTGAEILASEKPAVFLFMSSKDIYWFADSVKNIDEQ